MGLFTKHTCAFCGRQLGALNSALMSYKLADGQYLCDKCSAASCSSLLGTRWFQSKNKEQILEHMEEMKAMQNAIANEFDVTDVITYYNKPSKVLVSIDRNRRLWMVPKYKKDLFSFDHISRIDVDLDYEDEVKIIPRKAYTPPREDMPAPSRDGNMCGMTINIYIENHPFEVTAPIQIDICHEKPGMLQSYESYFEEVYGYGARCLELLESLMK